ncbi:thiamine pyrophosphate-binding protein [Brevibacterium album]|uniref:thiamine pyrophosphate-binding protein n=1 Tax=Brevibacterium album TaxID=417948 RepID=UPI0003FE05CC|nr:thiamine pyrophosphate-dependent enzyme [Brevibacterium album]
MRQSATVSEAVAAVVAAHSDVVFSLMGNGNAHLVAALTANGHRVVNVRHEAATVMAAEGYQLSTGRIPTASTTYGAGFANMLTSLAEARFARIPMVIVVGAAPTTGPRAIDFDQDTVAAGFHVPTLLVSRSDAGAVTRRAYAIARRDRVPVIVALPYDLVDSPVVEPGAGDDIGLPLPPQEEVLRDHEIEDPQKVTAEQAQDIVAALRSAQRPLILAGQGAVVAEAGSSLREIGDRIGALFATSVAASGLFDSEWDLGIVGGFASPRAADFAREADVVLVAGASLNLYQMRYNQLLSGAHTIIQVDTVSGPTNPQVTRFCRADAADAAYAILEGLGEGSLPGWRAVIDRPLTGDDDYSGADFGPDGRLDPRAVMMALNEMLPRERAITQDTGHFMTWATRHLDGPDTRGKILPGVALQVIGLGVGSVIGVAAGNPDRLPVLVTGDGGLAMELNELDTLVRETRSCLVVVINDDAYGMEVHQYGDRGAGLDMTAMRFPEMNFAAIARAVGGDGVKVRTMDDLKRVREWLEDGAEGLFIADVNVSKEVVADWLDLSNRYNGYTE